MGNFSWITSDTNRTVLNPWFKHPTLKPFKVYVLFSNGESFYGKYSGYGDIEDDDGNVLCEVFSKSYEIEIGKVAKDDKEKEKFRMKGIDMQDEQFVFLEGVHFDIDKWNKNEKKEYYDQCEVPERSQAQGDCPDEDTVDYCPSISDSEDEW